MDRLETVNKLAPQPGDIVYVRVGGDIDGETWVPSPDDIDNVYLAWDSLLGPGVKLVVTHHLVKPALGTNVNLTTWPPSYFSHER